MGDRNFRTGLLIGVLAAAVVGLSLALILGADDDGESTTVTTGADSGTTEAADPTVREVVFRSPSGNILCRITVEQATCAALEFAYRPPPRPQSCEVTAWGHTLAIGTFGPGKFLCRGDPPANTVSPPELSYGDRVRLGPFVCASDQLGVICENRGTGHGFALSRDRFGRR